MWARRLRDRPASARGSKLATERRRIGGTYHRCNAGPFFAGFDQYARVGTAVHIPDTESAQFVAGFPERRVRQNGSANKAIDDHMRDCRDTVAYETRTTELCVPPMSPRGPVLGQPSGTPVRLQPVEHVNPQLEPEVGLDPLTGCPKRGYGTHQNGQAGPQGPHGVRVPGVTYHHARSFGTDARLWSFRLVRTKTQCGAVPNCEGGRPEPVSRLHPTRVHLDLDLHSRIRQPADEHRRGRADVTEAAAQGRPARLEVPAIRQQIAHAHHVGKATAGFGQRLTDVAQALFSLLDHIVRDRHRRVVEPGRAGHVHPVAVDHRPGVADALFERRPAENHTPFRHAENAMQPATIRPIPQSTTCDIPKDMDRPDLPLPQLHAFVVLAEELHFGHAAARLGIAQPPLSQQIRRLEDRVGHPLFMRGPGHVSLTPAGEELLPAARSALTTLADALAATRAVAEGRAGTLRIGFAASLALTVLPALLRQFREQIPDARLQIQEMTTTPQLAALRDRSLDVGLLREPDDNTPDLVFRTVLTEPFVAVLPVGHPLAEHEHVHVEQLADSPFILLPRHVGPQLHDQILGLCIEAGFTPTIAQHAVEWQTICALVEAGLGVSIAPASIARIRLEGIVFRPLAPDAPRTRVAIAWHRTHPNPLINPLLALLATPDFTAEAPTRPPT